MSQEKKSQPKKNPQSDIQFLQNLEEEDQMRDDHGLAIIGRRDRKPKMPEEKKSK